MLHLARDLIALRRTMADLGLGRDRTPDAPDGVWAWGRGHRVVVVLNFTEDTVYLPGGSGISPQRPKNVTSVTSETTEATNSLSV